MQEVVPHRRQFVIAAFRIDRPDWKFVSLRDGLFLSHHKDLRVQEELAGTDLSLGESMVGGDGGRFVTVSWPYISGDAANLLSIYYTPSTPTPFVSSSPALAAELMTLPISGRTLRWGGINWFPAPGSRACGLSKLFRDQTLDLSTNAVVPLDRTIVPMASWDYAVDALASHLVRFATEVSAERILLALTAGLDSRTIAAAMAGAGVKFSGITQVIREVNHSDIEIAARVCSQLDIPHSVVPPEGHEEEQLRLWREHTLNSYCDADDNLLYPRQQYRFYQKGDVLLRGGCFEVGRNFFQRKLGGLSPTSATGAEIWKRMDGGEPDPASVAGLDDWLAWREDHPDGLSLLNSFYLDQRIGSWLAANEQGFDSLPGISLHPANSNTVFSALLTASHEGRSSGDMQMEVIRRLCPELLTIPINPPRKTKKARSFWKRTLSQFGYASSGT